AKAIIVQIVDDIGFVGCYHGASVPSRPDLPEISQDTWTHQVNQLRLEGFHPGKFPAVKSPVREDDGHFRIERKGDGPELHDLFLAGIRLVVGNAQKNLVPARPKVTNQLELGS